MSSMEKVPEVFHNAFGAGFLAAERGCYRILCCPASEQEEQDWMRGYDTYLRDHGRSPALPPVDSNAGDED